MTTPDDAPLGAARRLTGFDGLRAIAVIAVMAYHVFLYVPVFPNVTAVIEAALQLRVGVWIFFVVSGFLLYRPYAAAILEERSPPHPSGYAQARVLRIWPAYAAAFLILTFAWHWVTNVDGVGSVFVHLTLTQNYFQTELGTGLGPAWSLVVEVSFYIFLPVYAAVVARSARARTVWRAEVTGLAVLVAVGGLWQLTTTDHQLLATLLPSFLPTFALGMGLAVAVVHRRAGRLPALAERAWICWLGVVVLIVAKGLIGGAHGLQEGFRFENQLVYTTIAFLVVLPAVFGAPRARYNRLLRSRPFVLIGVISYGIFLWSIPLIEVTQREWIPGEPAFWGRSAVVAVVAFAGTIAIATLSWFVVERPALALKKKRAPDARARSSAGAPTSE